MAKILIVNPNTTASMTESIGAAARAGAASGTDLVAVTSPMGPASIESHYDEALSVRTTRALGAQTTRAFTTRPLPSPA